MAQSRCRLTGFRKLFRGFHHLRSCLHQNYSKTSINFAETGVALRQPQTGYDKEKGGDQGSVNYPGQGGERTLAPTTCFQLIPQSLASRRGILLRLAKRDNGAAAPTSPAPWGMPQGQGSAMGQCRRLRPDPRAPGPSTAGAFSCLSWFPLASVIPSHTALASFFSRARLPLVWFPN